MGRVAAIDFGLKRIGIALSDPSKKVALPLATVEGGKKAVHNIAEALKGKELDLIIMGLPLLMSGKKGEMSELVEKFAAELKTHFKVPIVLIDERLSSKMADAGMRELSLNRKERTAQLDRVAATMLLQSYLDRL